MDAIRQRVIADLGQADRDYIHNVVKAQRAFEVNSRVIQATDEMLQRASNL